MSEPATRIAERQATLPAAAPEAVTLGLSGLLPGVAVTPGDPVGVAVPPYRTRDDEDGWQNLLSDPEPGIQAKRRGMLEQIRAVLELNAYAQSKSKSLAAAAEERARAYRKTLETAWTGLLEQNRDGEAAVRWLALSLSNLQSSRARFRNKIYAIDASAREIASDAGREFLGEELSHYVNRPDPRQSRAYLVVQGWVGSTAALKKLARVTDEHRCLLITDAPSYDSLEALRVAAAEGGLLETLAGEAMSDRHTVVLANQGRARHRFRGQFTEEKEDLHVSLSGPWAGMFLDNVARGEPWKPAVGYKNPIPGVDGVRLDLQLKESDHFDLYLRHRLNPAILLSAGSEQVVVYGPDTLSKAGNGVQVGMAVVEMILVRYSEWIVNQYGLLNDLEEAEEVVRRKLTQFMVLNSGARRMFRAGSRVRVTTDEATRTLNIEYELFYRELAERAVIRLSKPVKKEKVGRVSTT